MPRGLQHAPKSTAGSLMAAHFSLISGRGCSARLSRRSTAASAHARRGEQRAQTCVQQLVDILLRLVHDVQNLNKVPCAATQRRVSGQLQWARTSSARRAGPCSPGAAPTCAGRMPRRRPAADARARAAGECEHAPQLNRARSGSALAGECAARVAPILSCPRAWLPNLAQVPLKRRVRALKQRRRRKGVSNGNASACGARGAPACPQPAAR